MAVKRAMYTGADNILTGFDVLKPAKSAFYSIWVDKDLFYQFNETDTDKGRKILADLLESAEADDNTDLLTIKFHPKLDNGYVTNKTPVIGTMYVRAAALEDNSTQVSGVGQGYNRPGDVPNAVYHMMKNIETSLPALAARLEKLEAAPMELPEAKEPDVLDRIGSLLEKPGAMDLVGQVIGRLFPQLQPQPNLQVAGVAKVDEPVRESKEVVNQALVEDIELSEEDNEIIDQALIDLSLYCNVVEMLPLLAKFAKDNKNMFDMVVMQLKNG